MGPQAAIGGGGGSEGSCMVLRALAAICVIKRKTSELKPHSSFGIHGSRPFSNRGARRAQPVLVPCHVFVVPPL